MIDPMRSILEVEDHRYATGQLSQTALRAGCRSSGSGRIARTVRAGDRWLERWRSIGHDPAQVVLGSVSASRIAGCCSESTLRKSPGNQTDARVRLSLTFAGQVATTRFRFDLDDHGLLLKI